MIIHMRCTCGRFLKHSRQCPDEHTGDVNITVEPCACSQASGTPRAGVIIEVQDEQVLGPMLGYSYGTRGAGNRLRFVVRRDSTAPFMANAWRYPGEIEWRS